MKQPMLTGFEKYGKSPDMMKIWESK